MSANGICHSKPNYEASENHVVARNGHMIEVYECNVCHVLIGRHVPACPVCHHGGLSKAGGLVGSSEAKDAGPETQ